MIALNKSFLRAILKFTFVLAYPACAPWGICISQEVITARTEAEAKEFFEGQVLPLLQKHCYPCHSHSSGLMESNLALDWKSGWVKGGERGPAIQPGKPEASLLVRVIEHIDPDLKMPEDKLDERDIEIFRTWIRNGAFDHRDAPSPSRDPKDWWSLKPLVSPPLPKPLSDQASSSIRKADASGTNNTHPIDAFVTEKLAAAKLDGVGLSLSPSASPRELIRRLFYDLIGLPPTPEQTQRFVDSPTPEAYLELVNGLLDSPRYGERWARHWLDSIHFADSHGYEHDVGRDHAWPYRDYVIQALNRDTPWQT